MSFNFSTVELLNKGDIDNACEIMWKLLNCNYGADFSYIVSLWCTVILG